MKVCEGRQAYLIQLEGLSQINEEQMNPRDGLEIYEDLIEIKAKTDSHLILIEMPLAQS